MMTMNRTTTPALASTRLGRRGFSLLELMLVLVILGLLSTVAAVALLPQAEKAKIRTTKTSMEVIRQQITAYQLEKNRVPDSLFSLVPDYLEDKGLRDGWSRDFYYSATPNGARAFSLVSSGPDGQFETDDDIDVWTMDMDTGG